MTFVGIIIAVLLLAIVLGNAGSRQALRQIIRFLVRVGILLVVLVVVGVAGVLGYDAAQDWLSGRQINVGAQIDFWIDSHPILSFAVLFGVSVIVMVGLNILSEVRGD